MNIFTSFYNQLKKLDGKMGIAMKNYLIISIVLVPILIWLLAVNTCGSIDYPIEENLRETTEEVISITIEDLIEAYEQNAMKADEAYKNKVLRITGEVAGIRASSHNYRDTYCLLLHDSYNQDEQKKEIIIYFNKNEISKLKDLVTGQTVTIIGRFIDNRWWRGLEIIDAFFEEIFNKNALIII